MCYLLNINTNNKVVSNDSEDIGETCKAIVKTEYKNIKPGTLKISVMQYQLHIGFGQDGMIFSLQKIWIVFQIGYLLLLLLCYKNMGAMTIL